MHRPLLRKAYALSCRLARQGIEGRRDAAQGKRQRVLSAVTRHKPHLRGFILAAELLQ